MKEEEMKKPVKAEDMFIDIGATSREDPGIEMKDQALEIGK